MNSHITKLFLTSLILNIGVIAWLISFEIRFNKFVNNQVKAFNSMSKISFSIQRDLVDTKKDITNNVNSINRGLLNTFATLDKMNGKIDVLDKSINGNEKRKVRIQKTVRLIKETLPKNGNILPECPKYPSPGELWSISSAIIDSADEYAVSPALIAAIIKQESAFCATAYSKAGAYGYMQLMPETAEEVAWDLFKKNNRTLSIFRGTDNIQMGTAYISKMILQFNGNLDLAIKSYNAGVIHIKRVLAGERTLYKETENYVKKVMFFKEEYEKLGLH